MTEARRKKITTVIAKRQFDITVILENVTDPHNISAVMRTCDATGIQEIFVLNTIIPTHRRKWNKKTSSSAAKWIDVHTYTQIEPCMRHVREKYHTVYATCLDIQATSIYDAPLEKPSAIIFGNEHSGVSDDIRNYADYYLVIPQVGMISSLNISVACAVTLYEAFRKKFLLSHYQNDELKYTKEKTELENRWKIGHSK